MFKMNDHYSVEFTRVKMSGLGYSNSRHKFLFKMIFYNYPVFYVSSMYKYVLCHNLFKSLFVYLKVKRIFRQLHISKRHLTLVLTDKAFDCPRALGVIKNNRLVAETDYVVHHKMSIDYVTKDYLKKYTWVSLNGFKKLSFEELEKELEENIKDNL